MRMIVALHQISYIMARTSSTQWYADVYCVLDKHA